MSSESNIKWIWFRIEDFNKYTFKIYDDHDEAISDFKYDIRRKLGNIDNINKYVELGKYYRPNYVSVVGEYTDDFSLEVDDNLIEEIKSKVEIKDSKHDTVIEWIKSNILNNRTGRRNLTPVEILSINDIEFDCKEWKTWNISSINDYAVEYLDGKSNRMDNIVSRGKLDLTCQISDAKDSIFELTAPLGQFRNYITNLLVNDNKTSGGSFQAVIRISDCKIKAVGEFSIDPAYSERCSLTGLPMGIVGPVPSGKEANVFFGKF